MRHIKLLLCLSSVGLLAAAAPVPSLKLFDGFRAGTWQMTPRDSAGSSATVAPQCLANPDRLVHTGHSSADGDCGHTVVEDGADRATVTYVCKGRGYGRTSIRREGDAFIVDAQGIDGREPYELRGEYKRVGDC